MVYSRRRGVRVVYGAVLEKRWVLSPEGSNPSLSATTVIPNHAEAE